MSYYYFETGLYFATILLPVFYGLKRFKVIDKASRFILLLLITSFVGEVIALYSALVYKTNLAVYNIVQLLIAIILCFYFNYCIDNFKKHNIGIIIAFVSFIVWLITIAKIHTLSSINSSFLAYKGIIIITMSIISMENLISNGSHHLFKILNSSHFWFAWILLIYWCFSIVQWILYQYYTSAANGFQYLNLSLVIITMLVNIGYTLVFFFYPKMNDKHGP